MATSKAHTNVQVMELALAIVERLDITAGEAAGMCDTMTTTTKARMVELAGLPRRLNVDAPALWADTKAYLVDIERVALVVAS